MRHGPGTHDSRGTPPVAALSVAALWLMAVSLGALCLIAPSLAALAPAAPASAAEIVPTDTLGAFKAWLDATHPGYGCDDGPAPFRNAKVAAAYPGERFYFVLTHARGIQPPFANSLSLVARMDSSGRFTPVGASGVESFQIGLRRVRSVRDARAAAAAILVLALGDPGERRFGIDERRVSAKKSRGGWRCTYSHGETGFVSEVAFDKQGRVRSVHCNPPPVP